MNEKLFKAAAKAHGLPEPIFEYKFHPKRKWRFDVLFEHPWMRDVAVEIQGGLFTGGRHTRGPALVKEMEKLNEAQLAGFTVLLVTPQQVDSGEVFELVKRAFWAAREASNGPTPDKRLPDG